MDRIFFMGLRRVLRYVRRFLDTQLRLFYEKRGHNSDLLVVRTQPWLAENIADDECGAEVRKKALRLPEARRGAAINQRQRRD